MTYSDRTYVRMGPGPGLGLIQCKTRMHSSRMRTVRYSGCLSCHIYLPSSYTPPCHACPLAMHAPPRHACLPLAMHVPCHTHPLCHECQPTTPPPHMPHTCEQNHKHLRKHNPAATTLRTVNIGPV